ncbi:hypothetical protein [Prosthecobacter sp.]|uniref:hypothetical protein n=1 Tax=Prosthecobacter sp. TaxID=1965333 RepID=UPI0037847250
MSIPEDGHKDHDHDHKDHAKSSSATTIPDSDDETASRLLRLTAIETADMALMQRYLTRVAKAPCLVMSNALRLLRTSPTLNL